MAAELSHENIWCDKWRYDDAECQYYEKQSGGSSSLGNLVNQIAKAREEIQHSLASSNRNCSTGAPPSSGAMSDVMNRLTKLEGMNQQLNKTVSTLESTVKDLTERLSDVVCGAKPTVAQVPSTKAAAKAQSPQEEDDDDDVDLFGSDDDEDAEAARVKEERLKAYAEKKAKKPGPIAKSSVLLDCKPWDDETDMKEMENMIRKIEMDGLLWGAAKLVPLAYGIQKLSILCIVVDDKVSVDDLIEKITDNEDYVQSVDIGAFNKI